jgi:hypothetical protein
MGTRYRAIFDHLKLPYEGVDNESSVKEIVHKANDAGRIILALPTELHGQFLKKLIPLKKPILCEKPIVKSTGELETIFNLVEKCNTHFTMVFQYQELIPFPHRKKGPTEYNYFRSGKDGIIWDCLQIIALANEDISLKNESPVWKCTINGTTLKLSDMDYAYLSFVQKWVKNQHKQKLTDLFNIHKKTEGIVNAAI